MQTDMVTMGHHSQMHRHAGSHGHNGTPLTEPIDRRTDLLTDAQTDSERHGHSGTPFTEQIYSQMHRHADTFRKT